MYKTIIVPLDGSTFAERAIATAAAIAERSAAELVLVRVRESYAYESTDYSRFDALSRRDQEEYLAHTAEQVETIYGLQAERTLLEGAVASAICDFALGMEAPLIVLSTHGRTGFSRFWLGSVADAIVRHATAPVLMLRHQSGDGVDVLPAAHRFAHVLVPLDGSDAAEVVLPQAVALADAFRARLTLLRVVAPIMAPVALYAVPYAAPLEQEEETLNIRLEGAAGYVNGVASHIFADQPALGVDTDVRVAESPATAILDATKAHDADTVALATHGRGLSRLVIASVADKVLRGGPDAVLVVRSEGTTEQRG
jgi:nucleotide-binding universal stress UspA family protein